MIYFDRIEVVNMLVPSAGTATLQSAFSLFSLLCSFASVEELKWLFLLQWWK